MVTAEALAEVEGTPTLSVPGENTMIAYGSANDVFAWLADTGYAELRFNDDDGSLTAREVAPVIPEPEEGEEAEEPVTWREASGSDLWIDEFHAEGAAGISERLQLKPDQAVVIAKTAEEQAIGSAANIEWKRVIQTPLAGPFLTAGAVLSVVGVILYILAIDHDRRGLGPRRGRRGLLLGLRDSMKRKPKVEPIHPSNQTNSDTLNMTDHRSGARRPLRRALLAGGLSATLLATGCSADYWPNPGQNEEAEAPIDSTASDVAPSPLTDKQLERIIHSISQVSIEADKALDAAVLESRFQGDALKQRAANYKIRKADEDYSVIPPYILDERLGYELIQSTSGWPRTMFVAVASSLTEPADAGEDMSDEAAETPAQDADESVQTEEESTPTLGLLIQQQTPHSNYRVQEILNLRGGIEMPPAAPAEEGTAVLSNDIQTLTLPPSQVGEKYATILNKGLEDEAAQFFNTEGDRILERSGVAWVKSEEENLAEQEGKATFSSEAKVKDTAPVALSTGAGGALVFVTLEEHRAAKADEDSELPVSKVVQAVSDLEGKKERIVQIVEHQLLFFVPNSSSDAKAQLLGSTSELVGATE